MRRDRGRRRRERAADRGQRRRQPGRAARRDRRHRARSRRPGPSALDDPGARGGARSSRASRTGRSSRPSPSPRVRGWPARCWSGSRWPRRSPGSTACRSCRSTTSRGTSTPRGCSIRTRQEKPAPEFPVVALVVSGGHTFLVEMTDHLQLPTARPDRRRRGGRGVRQGRPAARPALSGRPGDHERGRRRRSCTTGVSRAHGWVTRSTSRSAG